MSALTLNKRLTDSERAYEKRQCELRVIQAALAIKIHIERHPRLARWLIPTNTRNAFLGFCDLYLQQEEK
jgi:hypothetical protein